MMTGCSGVQSALSPAGQEAEQLASLFWLMTGGAVVVWIAVLALGIYAAYKAPDPNRHHHAQMVVVGGAVVPTIVLAALLVYTLPMIPPLLARAPEGSLRIKVTGEQWWWRVRYEPAGRVPFETANEIHLPVGEPVEFSLHSADVIHSFWIPSLGGKMDMIPGRVNRLTLHPKQVGRFRGVCAEYCGQSHAWMAFEVVVQPREEFERWLQRQGESR